MESLIPAMLGGIFVEVDGCRAKPENNHPEAFGPLSAILHTPPIGHKPSAPAAL